MVRSRWRRTGVVGLILASLFVIRGDAQQPAPDAQKPPVFRIGINFVRVDVIVNDKKTGRMVADLKQSDFQVAEDNKPQTVETFKLVKLDGGVTPSPDGPPGAIRNDDDEALEASRDDTRLFAIFLDDYHVRRGASMSVRAPLAKFIQAQLGPSDMLGVMYPLQAVSSLLMTRNHDAVVEGISGFLGRKGDYTPMNPMEQQYASYPAETVEQVRNQVSLSALRSLISHMGSLKEGRKALILVSEGYSDRLPPQLRDPIATAPGIANPNRGNPDAGLNDPAENSAAFFADTDMQLALRDVWDLANKNNVAIYAVDPRGLPTSEYDLSQPAINTLIDRQYLQSTMDTLRVLSEQTDGRAIVNRNDLATGMKQIVSDSSAYYLIGYTSSQTAPDGKFHEIKVQVKRPGVEVRARKGYWAATTDDVVRASAPKVEPIKGVQTALAAISAPAAAHNTIRTWIGTSRGTNGKTKVTFVWEPIPRVAGDRDARAESPARVMITAVGPDGAPYFRGHVPDAAPASAPPAAGAAASTPSRVTFDVNPGALQLRVSVEGAAAQVLDTETREIAVPDLTSAQATLGTPQFLRARTARDYQQLKTDPDSVPTAAREFSRTDRLLIRVPTYGPANTPVALSVHLLNRTGQAMLEIQTTPSTTPDMQQIELPLAGLASGEYILEIKADDAKELVGFRVTS